MSSNDPFPIPATMAPDLRRAYAYWEGLKRAENEMPFSDDLNLSALPDLRDRLLVIEVFENPERFRLNSVGRAYFEGAHVFDRKFVDEVALEGRLQFLRSQASATVESRAPTFYRHAATETGGAFSRLLLPLWGDGHVAMLLGSLDPH